MSDNKKEVLYSVYGPKNLQEMTAHELAEKQKETDLVLISCGATENHSGHLPLGADTYQGEFLVKRTHEKLMEMGIKSIPGFTIPFGVESNAFERSSMYGNCSLRPETLIAVVKDLILSLHRQGFKKFAIIENHAENNASLHVAAKSLADEYGVHCIVLDWIPPMNDRWPAILKNTKHQGHGGEDETACVLAAVPNLVNLTNVKPWYREESKETPVEFSGLQYYGGAVGIYFPVEEDKCPGYVGDPAAATIEEGLACYDAYADWMARVIRKYFYPSK